MRRTDVGSRSAAAFGTPPGRGAWFCGARCAVFAPEYLRAGGEVTPGGD